MDRGWTGMVGGWVDERKDGWMGGWVDGRMDDGQMDPSGTLLDGSIAHDGSSIYNNARNQHQGQGIQSGSCYNLPYRQYRRAMRTERSDNSADECPPRQQRITSHNHAITDELDRIMQHVDVPDHHSPVLVQRGRSLFAEAPVGHAGVFRRPTIRPATACSSNVHQHLRCSLLLLEDLAIEAVTTSTQ